jgi:hypothetical protein
MTVPYKELRNATLKYNPITIRQLQQNFSSIPWLKMINNYLSPADMLNLDDVINVAVPKFFERFNSFLPKVKKRSDLRTCRSTFLNKFLQNSSELHVCEPREKRGGLFTGRISKNGVELRQNCLREERIDASLEALHLGGREVLQIWHFT